VLHGTAVEVAGLDRASFGFDSVFSPGTQDEIFQECKDLVQSAIDGHNVSVLCYGQTGAGKTHTMYGTSSEPGLAPRMVRELINRLRNDRCAVTGSLVELHNNRLTDLLVPAASAAEQRGGACVRPSLGLRRGDVEAEVQVEGLEERPLHDLEDLEALVELGNDRRATASHTLNSDSSRSHVLLIVKIHRSVQNFSGIGAGSTGLPTCSKLLFCDLGGSERLKRTEAAGGQIREAIEINKSLSALGDVVEAIVQRRRHIPYRNHKLTQLLQDSLGGTAKALMFVNCSPAASSVAETVAALKFAARAKRVVNSSTLVSQVRATLAP
jgi:kinesin family protein C2/C3